MQKSLIDIIAPVLLLTACNVSVLEPQKMGSIALALSSDIEVEAQTKAGEVMDCSDFMVFINGTTLIGNSYSAGSLYKDMTGKVPYGTYVLSAESCSESVAAPVGKLGCARYTGSSGEVLVRSEATVPVAITCHMTNAKASIYLDESFTQDFTDITATLTVGSRTVTVIDPVNTADGKEAYFNIPENGNASLVYRITGTVAGRELTYTNASKPMSLERAKWAKITIKSNHNGNIGKPDIDVDGTMGDNYVTEIINPEEGTDVIDGNLSLPSILVNTSLNDVEVIECELGIYR